MGCSVAWVDQSHLFGAKRSAMENMAAVFGAWRMVANHPLPDAKCNCRYAEQAACANFCEDD